MEIREKLLKKILRLVLDEGEAGVIVLALEGSAILSSSVAGLKTFM